MVTCFCRRRTWSAPFVTSAFSRPVSRSAVKLISQMRLGRTNDHPHRDRHAPRYRPHTTDGVLRTSPYNDGIAAAKTSGPRRQTAARGILFQPHLLNDYLKQVLGLAFDESHVLYFWNYLYRSNYQNNESFINEGRHTPIVTPVYNI